MDTIEEEIDGCEAAGQEGAPPPVVILKHKAAHRHNMQLVLIHFIPNI